MRFAILFSLISLFAVSCGGPAVYTMWKDTAEMPGSPAPSAPAGPAISPDKCISSYTQVYPLAGDNVVVADMIRESAMKAGWASRRPEVHEYIPMDDMAGDYVLIIYFCEYVGQSKDPKKITVLVVPNGKYELSFYHDNVEETGNYHLNTWEFYSQAFEKVEDQNKLVNWIMSVADSLAMGFSANTEHFTFMRHPPDSSPEVDDDKPPCNNDGECDKRMESFNWCRSDCPCDFNGTCEADLGETHENCPDDCEEAEEAPPADPDAGV